MYRYYSVRNIGLPHGIKHPPIFHFVSEIYSYDDDGEESSYLEERSITLKELWLDGIPYGEDDEPMSLAGIEIFEKPRPQPL